MTSTLRVGTTRHPVLAATLLSMGLALGAATIGSAVAHNNTPARSATANAPRTSVGAITHIERIVSRDKPSGAGLVIGGVVGAALGNQVGGGDGRKAATVLGAVGGAAAGNEIEKRRSEHVSGYRVDVRFDSGETRSYTRTNVSGLRTGQRVKVVNGELRPA
jgi:outer membrane lipoprotein SlyB